LVAESPKSLSLLFSRHEVVNFEDTAKPGLRIFVRRAALHALLDKVSVDAFLAALRNIKVDK
jgi:hypothetical protein